jgi:exodeoxyribonuclease VIII
MSEIIRNQPIADYFKAEGVSSTQMKIVKRASLAHLLAYLQGKGSKESDALDFGRAFHAMLLEGKQEFVIHPLVYPITDPTPAEKKAGKKERPWNWTSNWCKDWASGYEIPVLSHDESDDLMGMVESVKANPDLASLFPAESELSIFAEIKGCKVKARLDTLPTSGPILDFKSTTNAEPSKFVRQAWDNAYFLQAALYLDVLALCGDKRREFWFVAIEKTYPYASSILKLTDGPVSFIEMGRRQYRDALSKIAEAKATNKWPAYGSFDGEMAASPYMLKELEGIA